MSFARVWSAQALYLKGELITIEVDLSRGLHSFSIVGLPDKAIEEARDRISAAIKNSGFDSPKSKNQKVVFSLAPAELEKQGSMFDMAMALAYLKASGDIEFDAVGKMFFGELALDGAVRKISGMLALAREARDLGFTEIFVPTQNAPEAALVEDITIYPVSSLLEVVNHLKEEVALSKQPPTRIRYSLPEQSVDLSDIKGQETAKRGLEIAAAGGHNIAFFGPPGTGKTMLARSLCGLLPTLAFDEILEVTAIHSVAGILRHEYIGHPPFRSPHHTSSYVSVLGGGSSPRPGEVTLAHKGVLFLDEFPEFDRRVLEALREPLEDGRINISRSKGSVSFPSRFILVAAMNPCRCGNHGSKKKPCTCTAANLHSYGQRISGPLMDRIDLWIEVREVDYDKLADMTFTETSSIVRRRVQEARAVQKIRCRKLGASEALNRELTSKDLPIHAPLSSEAKSILKSSAQKMRLSARAYHRVIKIARTIADLDKEKDIKTRHILEALQYRPRSGS